MKRIITILILFLLLNGCAILYVRTDGTPATREARTEMIDQQRKLDKYERKLAQYHRQQKREIIRNQNKSW